MKIRSGISEPQDVIFEGTVKGEGLCIAISEEDPSPANVTKWRVEVYVHLSQGWWFLGWFITNTIASDNSPARIVGFASCPGARGWKCVVRNAFPSTNVGFDAEMILQVGLCCGGGMPYGVFVPPQPPGTGGGPAGGT